MVVAVVAVGAGVVVDVSVVNVDVIHMSVVGGDSCVNC